MKPGEPRGWWNKHRFDGSNAEVKPRPSPLIRDCMYGPSLSTNGTFTGRKGLSMTSTARRSDRPSPRICDDQFVGAACPQNHNDRAVRAANSLRSNKPSGFFHASNEEDYEGEMMRIESHDDYSCNTYEATKPKSIDKETKIESLLQKLLESHEKTSKELKDELEINKKELVAKIEEVSHRVSKVEEGLHCTRFDLQIAKEDIQHQCQKSLSLETSLETFEGRYDWEIGVLHKKLTNPNPSLDWEEDPLCDDLKKEEEEVSTNSTCSTQGNVKSKVAFFDVMATEKQSKSPSRDQSPSPRYESLRPHGRVPGMRPDSPRPHGRDGSMRPGPSLRPTSSNSSPHDQASSVCPDPSLPHTHDSSMRQLTCPTLSFWRPTPSLDSKAQSSTEGPRPMFSAQVIPHHFEDGENDLEESKTLEDKSQTLFQKGKREEPEVFDEIGKLFQNPNEKGKSLSISTCSVPSHILQETKEEDTMEKRNELMEESKELVESNIKDNHVVPMEREEPKPIEPTLATDPLITRNPTLPVTEGEGSETPTPCSPNVSPSQENREGEAVKVEEGTTMDLKRTEELNPKFLETTIYQSFEETMEEDELIPMSQMHRPETPRSPNPTDSPRSDHIRSNGRVGCRRTALYRPYGRDGTMRLDSNCSTSPRLQHNQPDDSPRPHGRTSCVRPDSHRPHGRPASLRQSIDPPDSQPVNLRQPPDHRQPVCRTVDLRTNPQPTSRLYDCSLDPRQDQDQPVSPRTISTRRPNHIDDSHLPVCRPRDRYTEPQPPRRPPDQPPDQPVCRTTDPCTHQQPTNLQPLDRTTNCPPDIAWKTNWQEAMGMDTKGRCKAIGLSEPHGMEKGDGESSYSQVCTISTTSNDSFSQESEKKEIRKIPDGCEEWTEEEIDAYYAEQAIEMSLCDYSREDVTYDDFFTDEDDDREPREAYSCMANQIPLDNSAGNDDVQRFRKEAEAIEPGSFKPRQPPAPHLGLCQDDKPFRRDQPRYSLPPYRDKGDEISAKIEQLERRIKREVTLREVIEMRVNDLEELLSDEYARFIRSRDLLTEIDTTLKEKYREIDKKLNEFTRRVAGRDNDAEEEETEPSDKVEEERPDLRTIYNIVKARHKSSHLHELENRGSSKKKGDQPFGGMEENLMRINGELPKEANTETSSPPA